MVTEYRSTGCAFVVHSPFPNSEVCGLHSTHPEFTVAYLVCAKALQKLRRPDEALQFVLQGQV